MSARTRRTTDAKRSPLQNPNQLRIIVAGVALLGGYAGIYMPLSAKIDQSHRELVIEQKRLDLVRDIEILREQRERFQHLLPDKADMNDWVAHILKGVRQYPLKLNLLDPDTVREIGPYKAVVLRIELQGHLSDLNDFLLWLESNDRLIRVDAVSIQPPREGDGTLLMQTIVLGMMG